MIAIDVEHMLAGGVHGVEVIGVLDCFLGRSGAAAPLFAGPGQRFLAQVEGAHLMTRFGEVRRHPATHVAEADECDTRHCILLRKQTVNPNGQH